MNSKSFLAAFDRLGTRLLTVTLLLCALMLASPANILADTYTYTGSPLGADLPNAFDPSFTSVTGFFTIGAALPANLPQTDITALVTNFSFSDGADTFSTADLPLASEAFIVSTGPTGALNNWEVLLGDSSGALINSCRVVPQVPWGDCWPGTGYGGTGDEVFHPGYVGLVVPGSGTWTTPEPSSLLLLGAGLLGLGGGVKRKLFS